MSTMQVEIRKESERIVMRLNGDLDGSSANQVVHALQRIHGESKGQTIILDLSSTHKLEYFGIATLSRFIRSHGGQFRAIKLDGLQASAQNVFRRFGLTEATVC